MGGGGWRLQLRLGCARAPPGPGCWPTRGGRLLRQRRPQSRAHPRVSEADTLYRPPQFLSTKPKWGEQTGGGNAASRLAAEGPRLCVLGCQRASGWSFPCCAPARAETSVVRTPGGGGKSQITRYPAPRAQHSQPAGRLILAQNTKTRTLAPSSGKVSQRGDYSLLQPASRKDQSQPGSGGGGQKKKKGLAQLSGLLLKTLPPGSPVNTDANSVPLAGK